MYLPFSRPVFAVHHPHGAHVDKDELPPRVMEVVVHKAMERLQVSKRVKGGRGQAICFSLTFSLGVSAAAYVSCSASFCISLICRHILPVYCRCQCVSLTYTKSYLFRNNLPLLSSVGANHAYAPHAQLLRQRR